MTTDETREIQELREEVARLREVVLAHLEGRGRDLPARRWGHERGGERRPHRGVGYRHQRAEAVPTPRRHSGEGVQRHRRHPRRGGWGVEVVHAQRGGAAPGLTRSPATLRPLLRRGPLCVSHPRSYFSSGGRTARVDGRGRAPFAGDGERLEPLRRPLEEDGRGSACFGAESIRQVSPRPKS
jgi:hypothetical protein